MEVPVMFSNDTTKKWYLEKWKSEKSVASWWSKRVVFSNLQKCAYYAVQKMHINRLRSLIDEFDLWAPKKNT